MKRILIFLLCALLLASLVSCGSIDEPVLNPGPAPENPPYVPTPLAVEFFYTTYQNMSPWKKYTDGTPNTAPVTSEEQPAIASPTEEA